MNRTAKSAFSSIQESAARFRNNMTDILTAYRKERRSAQQKASQYKDEEKVFSDSNAALVRNARESIAKAEKSFIDSVAPELETLQKELSLHLLTAPGSQFITTLSLYRDFGIKPTKADIVALVQMCQGSTLGLRCINGVLESNKSEFTITFPDVAAFEKDLEDLSRLTCGDFHYSPNELHSEANHVYSGTPVIRNGFDSGAKWDSVKLIVARADFESVVKKLDEMSERWTSSVIPSIVTRESYKDTTDPKTGKIITAEAQYNEDKAATAESASIEQRPGGENIRSVSDAKAAAEIVDSYLRN